MYLKQVFIERKMTQHLSVKISDAKSTFENSVNAYGVHLKQLLQLVNIGNIIPRCFVES